MSKKGQIFKAGLTILISVFMVSAVVSATTTIGNNVDVGGTLDVTGVTTLSDNVTQAITQTTTGYTTPYGLEWTAGAAMTAGGSNGIYSIVNPVEDVQNAYCLRGRMDLRDATGAVAVNQLHAIDALINLSETENYTVDDNISVIGGAIHGGTSGVMTGTGIGALGGATLNVFFGMWGPTADQDLTVETNFIKMISHAGTTVDFGLNIESSSDMRAGILLNNHASNLPATMDAGIEMISATSKMVYGVDMNLASFTGAEIRGSNGETIDNKADGIWNLGSAILQTTPETVTCSANAGTASALIRTSLLVTDGGGDTNDDTVSLDDGVAGAEKVFVYMTETDAGDSANVTPTHLAGWTKITFDAPGEGCIMVFDGTNWSVVSNNGGVLS